MKTLPIDFKNFGFVEREFINGERVKNKCGRDFLYYSLSYYFPHEFNKNINNPLMIDKHKIFGYSTSSSLSWSMVQFYKVPKLFKKLGLLLLINGREIKTFANFIFSIINRNKTSANDAIREVEESVDTGSVVGIDISLGFLGLLDHLIFVYGYDEKYFYVFDTYQVSGLEYEKITKDNKYVMKISKDTIRKRWSRFGRVWIINK